MDFTNFEKMHYGFIGLGLIGGSIAGTPGKVSGVYDHRL